MSQIATFKPIRILVVDDDPAFVEMAVFCLKGAGYDVSTAANGHEAMDLLERQDFDLAMIDLIMPHVDGFRLIAMMRSTPHMAAVPVLVISSRNDVRAFEEALTLGANAFLTKPLTWTLLPTQVRYVLQAQAGPRTPAAAATPPAIIRKATAG